jgi:hypothetical protein
MVQANVAAQAFDASDVQGSGLKDFRRLGKTKILRAPPVRQKRLSGAWCFLDRFEDSSYGACIVRSF